MDDTASAVLFPWMVQTLGVVVFLLLTRFEVPVPYAAVMFVFGVIMGVGASASVWNAGDEDTSSQSRIVTSITQWSNMNSAVLLLVFLPGLIFRDAIEVNFNLFIKSLPQLLILAFPMVLVGTVLTALVPYFVLPFLDWPLSLAATLGAILASTDPVAVGSVLKQAGAPPRLQMHISGESLINDGSAVVFFSIFSTQYLASLGYAHHIHLGEGIAIFARMSLGGVAVGMAFAGGLLIMLYELDRRLEPEYNVLQVVVALTFAYLSYYVSEQVCQMSGVIACVVCGLTARALGIGLITDNRMMDSYLALMEYFLNTLLFALGGVVWGKVVAEGFHNNTLNGEYWGYLLLLFVFVVLIRFFQVALFYPVFSRVGLKSDWKESAFLAFAGLRGAVGIALALSLNRSVREVTDDEDKLVATEVLEFLAGGVTLLSLLLNGTTAGPVLRWLRLAKPAASRKQALRLFRASAETFVYEEYRKLLLEKRFAKTSFDVVRTHVPHVKREPIVTTARRSILAESIASIGSGLDEDHYRYTESIRLLTQSDRQCPDEMVADLRRIFLELLNEAYSREIANGELSRREDNGMNVDLLRQSVKFALADVDHNEAIHDFEYTQNFRLWEDAKSLATRQYELWKHGSDSKCCTYTYQQDRSTVLRTVSFIEAHRLAEKKLITYVDSLASESLEDETVSTYFGNAVNIVLKESAQQVHEAKETLDKIPCSTILLITSHHVCTILLRRLAEFVEMNAADGVITKKEARLELDRIDRNLAAARTCSKECKEFVSGRHSCIGHNSFVEQSPRLSPPDSKKSEETGDSDSLDVDKGDALVSKNV